MFGSIFIDNEKANQKIDDTDKKGKGVAGTLGSMVGTAAKWGGAIVAGAGVAVGGMLALANKTAAAADEIDKLSERTGINREELQRWKYAAGQSGADVGKLEVGIKKLSNQMDDAMTGNKKAVESFQKLGISLDDLKNKSQEDIFSEVMNALADMEQGAQRNALGNDLLGKSYTEMLPLLNAGSQGMKDLRDRADELGLVMSEDAVKANVKFGDTMDDLKQALGAVFMQISNAALPILQLFINLILDHMPQIQTVMQTVFGVIRSLMDGFIQGIQFVIQWVKQWAGDNQDKLNGLRDMFMAFFEATKNLIVSFVEYAVAFWNKYGDDIMKIIKLAFDFVSTTIKTALTIITDVFNIFAALFRGDWEALWEGVKKLFVDIIEGIANNFKGAVNLIAGILGSLKDIAIERAKDIARGLWEGLKSMGGWLIEKVEEWIESVIPSPIKKLLRISSPSGVTTEYGEDIGEGLAVGIENKLGRVTGAVGKLVGAVTTSPVWEAAGVASEKLTGFAAEIKSLLDMSPTATSVTEAGGWDAWEAMVAKDMGFKPSGMIVPGMATGGDIIKSGLAVVGEHGPELVDLPEGAKVRPLSQTAGAGVVFERGAFEGAFILDDYGVDRLMDRVMARIRSGGVLAGA